MRFLGSTLILTSTDSHVGHISILSIWNMASLPWPFCRWRFCGGNILKWTIAPVSRILFDSLGLYRSRMCHHLYYPWAVLSPNSLTVTDDCENCRQRNQRYVISSHEEPDEWTCGQCSGKGICQNYWSNDGILKRSAVPIWLYRELFYLARLRMKSGSDVHTIWLDNAHFRSTKMDWHWIICQKKVTADVAIDSLP